jgi:hypothetical protein
MQFKATIITLVALSLLSLVGCGSRSGTLKPAPPIATPLDGVVSRANQADFSTDAQLLAARESTNGYISAATAAQVDADLTAIRANTPAVASVHASPTADATSILVDVSKTATWYSAWSAGTVTTGVAAIDSLSNTYHATAVSTVVTYSTYSTFKVSFADILATAYVAAAYKTADPGIQNAYVNLTIGTSDNITRQVTSTTRVYSFTHGWGDCTAGCINKHTWQFTINADGSITAVESGTPLS